jgi:hypothetical protein
MKVCVSALAGALAVSLALAGCQGGDAPATDVKNDPAAKTTPTGTAAAKAPAAAATTSMPAAPPAVPAMVGGGQAPAAKPTGEPSLAAPGAGQEAPAVSEGKSAPPTVAEWEAAPSANTVGPNSAPRDCELKVVREWLKVNCRGNIKEVTNMEGFGQKNFDYFELVTPGKVVDFVVRLKKGQAIKARIIREGQSASLFVNWPSQSPKPSIIALQIYIPK